MLRRLLTVTLVTAFALGATAVPPAVADDPPFVGWTALLPALGDQYEPNSADDCVAGRPTCVDQAIRQLSARFDSLGRACDHNAIFGLSYLRTTEEYQRAAAEPGFFTDPRFVNHEDVVFARYYFGAYDAWAAGRREAVPPAWRIAFDAAAARQVSGSGNLMLAMSAHVNRDLPFVLASIGLVTPEGASRKPDHDQVNVFLNRVTEPLLAELAARFDPSTDDTATPYGLSYTALMQVLVTWREGAWRNAERLVSAPDDTARNAVAAEIETSAAATSQALMPQYRYLPPVTSSAARDAFCATHHG